MPSPEKNAQQSCEAVRKHWRIENNLYWALDIVFREDENRVREEFAPENMAMLCHIALILLR